MLSDFSIRVRTSSAILYCTPTMPPMSFLQTRYILYRGFFIVIWRRKTRLVIYCPGNGDKHVCVVMVSKWYDMMSYELLQMITILIHVSVLNKLDAFSPKAKLSRCQLSCNLRHRVLSLWQPQIAPVTTKLASWQLCGSLIVTSPWGHVNITASQIIDNSTVCSTVQKLMKHHSFELLALWECSGKWFLSQRDTNAESGVLVMTSYEICRHILKYITELNMIIENFNNQIKQTILFRNRHVVRLSISVSLVCFAAPECNWYQSSR